MSQHGNPLIGATNGDTIAGIREYSRSLLRLLDGDDEAERVVTTGLQMILGAVESLGETPGTEKS